MGAILEPEAGEVAVTHPCALEVSRTVDMFYASNIGGPIRIALATSSDGLSWDRRGTVLEPSGQGPDGSSVHTPCVVRLHDGSVGMWYAGIPIGDEGSATASASRGSPALGSPETPAGNRLHPHSR